MLKFDCYNLEFKYIPEFRCVLNELSAIEFNILSVSIKGNVVLCRYVNGVKEFKEFRNVEITANHSKDTFIHYDMPENMKQWLYVVRTLSNSDSLPLFYFIHSIDVIKVTDICVDGITFKIPGLFGLSNIKWEMFLDWILDLRSCDCLHVKIRHKNKTIYFTYLEGVLYRKQLFTDIDNKMTLYVSSFDEVAKVFPEFSILGVNYGVSVLGIGSIISSYANATGLAKYKFRYRVNV